MLDALDEGAVTEHARTVAADAGGIDVSFNLITRGGEPSLPRAWPPTTPERHLRPHLG